MPFCFRNCLLPGTPTISFAFTKWCFCTSIRFGLLSLKGNLVPMTSMWSAKKSLFLFTCFIFAGLSLYFEDGHDDLDDCKYLTSEKKSCHIRRLKFFDSFSSHKMTIPWRILTLFLHCFDFCSLKHPVAFILEIHCDFICVNSKLFFSPHKIPILFS